MDAQEDFGENERDKDNQHGVELALLGFDCQAANRPHSPWFEVLPLHVGYLFKIGYYKEPGAPLSRDFPFEYMKQGKYISGDERGGFKVAKVNLPLPDRRLRLFLEGKEDWLEEGLFVPVKKKIRKEGL
jgi:hypothetical protein